MRKNLELLWFRFSRSRLAAALVAVASVAVASVALAVEIPLVTVCRVEKNVLFEETAFAQGTVRARDSATIAARVPGVIENLLVREGDAVREGETLFKTDARNLANAVRVAEDDLNLAKAKERQTKASADKARLDADRLKRLAAESAVPLDAAEKASVGAESAAAALDAAAAMIRKAETALAVAQKNLADSEVRAPFDGRVVAKLHETGDFTGPGVPVLRLENTAAYEVRFMLSAADYPRVKVGETRARLRVGDGDGADAEREFPVTYRSPDVNPVSRTFEIRVAVPDDCALVPGTLCDATIVFASRRTDALPAAAVNPIGGTNTIFIVENGRVKSAAVEAGAIAAGLREVRGVPDDAAVVAEAMLLLNPGDEVRTR